MAGKKPSWVKTVKLEGTGRAAQNHAQEEVIREFLDPDMKPLHRLMLNYATGTGKGKAALELAAAFYDQVSQDPVLIGTFTEKGRDVVWPREIAKWGRMHPFTRTVESYCYASFSLIKGRKYSLIILDEAQHYTLLASSFFRENEVKGVILLTATEPRDREKKKLIRELTGGRRLIISQADAIAAGLINDFEVYVMMVKPNDTDRFKMLKNSNTLYTEWSGYAKKCQLVTSAMKSGNGTRIKFALIDRMRYIGNSKTKQLAAVYIQDQFRRKGERFLTIAAGINQANAIGKYISHSQTTDEHYKLFLNNRIDELTSVAQLKEGENFDDLGRLLYVQAASDPNELTQITGRALRLEVGQVSKVFILCMTGTYDEKQVQKALANVAPHRIKYMELPAEKYWK